MRAELSISSEELNDEDLQDLTIELRRTLIDETNIDAELMEGVTEKESRGEPITLGLIALTFLTSGAAIALFNVFKTFFDRNTSIELELTKDDGSKLNIKAENIRLEDLKNFLGN